MGHLEHYLISKETIGTMITIDWGNANDTLLVWRFETKWTAQEFVTALKQSNRMVTNRGRLVDIMVDMQSTIQFPRNMLQVALLGLTNVPVGIRRVVIISRSNTWIKLYNMVIQHYNVPDLNIHFVSDANEAYAIIYMDDSRSA